MQVISLKEYAEQSHISYEAVRKQVIRYAAELEGHIIKDGRQQFLDEEAVAFLDEKRKKNPVVIYQANKDEEIERLQKEKEALLLKLAAVQNQLIQAQEENKSLIEENCKIFLLEADNEAAKQKIEATEEQLHVTEEVAKSYEQDRDRERQRAEGAEQQLSDLKEQNDALWAHLDKMKNRTLIERILNKKID